MNQDLPQIPKLEAPEVSAPRPVRPWDLFNANKARVEEQIGKERMAICATCPFLISATKQCKKCGCFMHLKTKLADATCPIGKWGAVNVPLAE
jgi:hypothetical protein